MTTACLPGHCRGTRFTVGAQDPSTPPPGTATESYYSTSLAKEMFLLYHIIIRTIARSSVIQSNIMHVITVADIVCVDARGSLSQ